MSTATVTDSDGDVVTTTDTPVATPLLHQHHGMIHFGPDGAYVHSGRPLDPGSFFAGLMLGLLLYFIVQSAIRRQARREARGAARAAAIGPQVDARDHDGMAAAVAALSRRTATLETIVTDPAHRTAGEIDALRDPVTPTAAR